MKRFVPAAFAAIFLLTGCTGCSSDRKTSLTPDMVFSGGSVEIDGYKPPASMVNITSQQLVSNIRIGWNLGKSLDSCLTDSDYDGVPDITPPNGEVTETLWGNPPASEQLFKELVDSGINAVRIPITWRDHMDENGTIEEGWLNRVTQIVDQAYNCGMYVIVTVYHDGAQDIESGAWLRSAAEDYESVSARYEYLWRQIAQHFRTYNERLLFESMNEVDFLSVSDDESYELLNSLNQLFTDIVRSSGGNNPWRHLLIAGMNADITATCDSRFKMPTDTSGKCILSVHYYTPVTFCRSAISNYWGSPTDQSWMEYQLRELKLNFTSRDIPVIITEYGVKGRDRASRVFFCEKLTKICHGAGIAAFLWDDGTELDRVDFTWNDPELIKALKRASSGKDYTPEKLTPERLTTHEASQEATREASQEATRETSQEAAPAAGSAES